MIMIKKNISLTPEGKKELEKELDELIKNRPAVTERIATARAFGDLSENEEYSSTCLKNSLTRKRFFIFRKKNPRLFIASSS